MAIPITMASLNSLSFFPSSFIPSKPNLIFTSSLSLSSAVTFTHLTSVTAVSNAAVTATGVGEDLPVNYDEFFPESSPSDRRRAGILLHPTSLPGPHGIGDLGDEAFRFIDWLHSAGCSLWQVLPLVPPGRKANEEGSPYSGQDANCGNTLLISLEELVKDGSLYSEELPEPVDAERVNYDTIAQIKDPLVAKAGLRMQHVLLQLTEFVTHFLVGQIELFIAQQFLFQRQWKKVRNYALLKGIKIMGDMPIYVGYHNADVWANKKHFLLNRKGFPLLVSGVPPDAFSETGQLWDRCGDLVMDSLALSGKAGPLYDWTATEKDGFSWWICRIRRAMDLYDEFRIDHFRGFAGFWAVPSEAKIATVGRWKAGPGKSLFDAIFKTVGEIDIIAEDLGVITEDVVQLRKSIGAPGMAVLQFGFGSDAENPHLPHNHERNQVVYTGTHDNDTVLGWWDNLKQEERHHVLSYLSLNEGNDISWGLIQGALSSVAKTAIIPMQDVLGLDNSARMNIPATQFGNWSWRIPSSLSFESLDAEATKLRDLLSMYGRL
uniref:4-alpha-glucanotransferase n=1 Tax=Chenopodium quinoa TaxID=63459 RepID=A0A803LMU8_CHEQI